MPEDIKLEILLVDDNKADIWMIDDFIRERKHNVKLTVLRDGQEAVSYLNKESDFQDAPDPSLIVLDLNMPRLNGKEVLSRISQNGRFSHIPVVVLTSSSNPRDEEECRQLGADYYFTKPASLEDYDFIVSSFIRIARHSRESKDEKD
ncbi:MAG: response regulator [Ignavibacteria bacterium]|jgi:CheY-like chemotaxis protein|nr:response regulator [Ignavibacteria bacterium]MCU7501760.1 response regulator [Ignavibacteria bacterium]MCU7516833.1 response regulator [Ignavibacteria bacterium]